MTVGISKPPKRISIHYGDIGYSINFEKENNAGGWVGYYNSWNKVKKQLDRIHKGEI